MTNLPANWDVSEDYESLILWHKIHDYERRLKDARRRKIAARRVGRTGSGGPK